MTGIYIVMQLRFEWWSTKILFQQLAVIYNLLHMMRIKQLRKRVGMGGGGGGGKRVGMGGGGRNYGINS